MKKNLSLIVSAAALVLVVVCVLKLISVADRLDGMQQNISSQLSDMRSGIDGIGTQVRDAVEEQSSLLSYSGWEYTDTDISSGSVKISCTITPKEYTESTEVFIVCNGDEYPMTLENRDYRVSLSLPVFENNVISSVVFTDGDTIRTQSIDINILPRYDILPVVSGRFEGSGQGKKDSGVFSYTRKGLAAINVDRADQGSIERAEIVFVTGGEERRREQIDLSYSAQEDYIDKASSGNEHISMPEESKYDEGQYRHIYYYIDDTAEINFGSSDEIYVELYYDNGLCFRSLCDSVSIDDDGSLGHDKYMYVGAEGSIIDENGEELYSAMD